MNAQNQQIQLLLTIRLKRLHREGYTGIRYLDLENIFFRYVWRQEVPKSISIISDEIINMSTDRIIQYLSVDASVQGSRRNISDILGEV